MKAAVRLAQEVAPLDFSRLVRIGVLASSVLLSGTPALASPEECILAHSDGQLARKGGELQRAVGLFQSCFSDEECPKVVRMECLELMKAAETATPTVIFSVQDDEGNDLKNVKVYAGDTLLTDTLDGLPIPLDTGSYTFRFEVPEDEVLTKVVIVREGEKNRLVDVRMARKPPAQVPPEPSPAILTEVPPPVEEEPRRGKRSAAWIMAGTSIAGLGVFSAFAIIGNDRKKELDGCSPSCPPSLEDKHSELKTDYLIADIGLGVGVVSGAVATYLFLRKKDRQLARATRRSLPKLRVNTAATGATLEFASRF